MLFSPKNIAFGLDIGDKTVKIAELKLIKDIRGKERLFLTALNETSLPDEVIVNGEIKNAPVVTDIIKKCLRTSKGKILSTKAVVASLPESQSYMKLIVRQKEELEQSDIKKILNQHFPVEAEKLYFDWRPVGQNRIIVAAAPKNLIDSYVSVIEQAGLVPVSLEMESAAIGRALTVEKDNPEKPKIFMDLGATRSAIIAVYRECPVVALTIPLSGAAITKDIAKSEKIDFDAAEQLKLSCVFGDKKCSAKIKKVIEARVNAAMPSIAAGIRYINRLLQYKTDKILVCGGVASASGIAALLSAKLKIKVRRADPMANIVLRKGIKASSEELLKYATAIGLAARGTEPDVLIFR